MFTEARLFYYYKAAFALIVVFVLRYKHLPTRVLGIFSSVQQWIAL
ncbi:hypothetical protein ACSVDA_22665 [Cytobacillus sp. Hm23]